MNNSIISNHSKPLNCFRNWNRWKEWRQVRRIQQDNSADSNEPDAQVIADEETGDIPDGELCGQHSFHVDTGR